MKKKYSEVELWAMDEHRLGLKPIIKRVWARKGEKPIAIVHHRYEWLYLYAFVCPQIGKTYWCIMPRVGIDIYEIVLKEFAKSAGASQSKGILLVLDQAGWHSKKDLPMGIELAFLPSYSPELQPAERLWELTDDTLVNECFANLDDLEKSLSKQCAYLLKQHDLISKKTLFHWWPLV